MQPSGSEVLQVHSFMKLSKGYLHHVQFFLNYPNLANRIILMQIQICIKAEEEKGIWRFKQEKFNMQRDYIHEEPEGGIYTIVSELKSLLSFI